MTSEITSLFNYTDNYEIMNLLIMQLSPPVGDYSISKWGIPTWNESDMANINIAHISIQNFS
jgi:hypothetical protein